MNEDKLTPAEERRVGAALTFSNQQSMNFSDALHQIKHGGRLTRSGWNGPEQFVFLIPGSTFYPSRTEMVKIFGKGTEINYRAHIDLRAVDGTVGVWQPSMSDVLANDWELVE